MAKYNLILVPEGAVVPEELRLPAAPRGDFIAMIAAGAEQPVIVQVGSRELQALVEYRDLLDVDITAVIGLPGTMYSTIWNTYVSTMRRTTIDQLLSDQSDANDVKSDAGQIEETNPFLRRKAVKPLDTHQNSGTVDTNDDEQTGDL